jgi:hypothetical protein
MSCVPRLAPAALQNHMELTTLSICHAPVRPLRAKNASYGGVINGQVGFRDLALPGAPFMMS